MRVKYLASTIVLLILLTWSFDSRAQDEMPGSDLNGLASPDPNSYDDKPLLFESEGKISKSPLDSTGTRTTVISPVKKSATPSEAAKKKEESDPLNFNFLFYIIQTFKASDLMMEN
jgi:hypothetical protein